MLTRFLSSRRFLAAYSCCLTVVLCLTVFYGFAAVERRATFDEITVHRINVVEPDGTIRLILSNKANAPGVYIRNKQYPHPTRQVAGLLFFDDQGTEDGGLVYGLSVDKAGRVTGSNVHLSFDKYMQDQIFTVDAGQEGKSTYSTLTMQDRGDYSIQEALEASARISKLPEDQRAAEWKKFAATHPGDHTRVVLGRASDGGSVLRLKDMEGRDRIVLRVAPDGTPALQMLDAEGKVVGEMPQAAGRPR